LIKEHHQEAVEGFAKRPALYGAPLKAISFKNGEGVRQRV
jgi:hypothetical protein